MDTNEQLVAYLREKFPQRGVLAPLLAQYLNLEQEAVYRRLRNEVPFSFKEVIRLSQILDFSLDQLAQLNAEPEKQEDEDTAATHYLMHMYLPKVEIVSGKAYPMLNDFFNNFSIKKEPHSVFWVTTNHLPWSILMRNEVLYRLHLMHVMHIYHDPNARTNFREYPMIEPVKALIGAVRDEAKSIEKSTFIMNRMIFANAVSYVKYYADLGMVDKESVLLLRDNLHALLDELEDNATHGRNNFGNATDFIVTDVVFKNGYSTLKAEQPHVIFEPFTGGFLHSNNANMFEQVQICIGEAAKSGISISVVNERRRNAFMRQQRAYIEKLSEFARTMDEEQPWQNVRSWI